MEPARMIEPPKLIALYAPVMQSGKTEVAKVLCEQHGYKLVKFADPVKAMVRTFLQMTGAGEVLIERMLEGDLKEAVIPGLGKTTRHLLQTLGTDWGRDRVQQNVWASLTAHRLREHLASGQSVVVDDMRFPNEYDVIVGMGGQPLRVHRPGAAPYKAHPSEGLLDNHLMPTLENSGTLEQLRYAASILPSLLDT